MGTGICLFSAGKMRFPALGLRFISNKTIEWNSNRTATEKMGFVLLDTGI